MVSGSIALPIGYSVFAFSCISYIADKLHKENCGHNAIVDVFCYLFFFPKMLAGPVNRFDDFHTQLNCCQKPSLSSMYKAFKIIVFSAFCKFCLADNLGWVVGTDAVGINAWFVSFIFAIQLFFDFYAYSNFAIAFALLVGINLPVSFESPYKAASFREFWQRWNITVSEWLRDYIYIPLGGNQVRNKFQISLNVLITFIVSGIWHGAATPFMIWGVAHGILVVLEKTFNNGIKNSIASLCYRIGVFVTVVFLWQLFRLGDLNEVVTYIQQLFVFSKPDDEILSYLLISLLSLMLIDSDKVKNLVFTISESRPFIYKEVGLVCVMLFAILLFSSHPNFNFFYFNF